MSLTGGTDLVNNRLRQSLTHSGGMLFSGSNKATPDSWRDAGWIAELFSERKRQ